MHRSVVWPVWLAGEHGASNRPAPSPALGSTAAPTGLAPDGRRRDLSGEETEVSDGGDEPGDRRTVVVRQERKKQTLDEFFQQQLGALQ